MNEWEKIVLPLKGKQEIQKRSPGTFHVEARRQDEATVISGANPTGAGVDRTY